METARARLANGEKLLFSHAPEGFDAFLCADLARALAREAEGRPAVFVHVARDVSRSAAFREALRFANPDIEILDVPGWDCQPYDRVSPHAGVVARRMTAFSRLARASSSADRPRVVTTTADCLLQRAPPKKMIAAESFSAAPGNLVKLDELCLWLEANGFLRASTVRETGEYAQRGGLIDLFPPGLPTPIRLDFFGDALESIRSFDPETQRATGQLRALDLTPMSELRLTSDAMRRFRQNYAARFGGQTRGDALYEAVSEGRRHHGMEHWLPLFYERMDTLFDYLGDAPLMLDALAEEAAVERLGQIADYYDARKEAFDLSPANANYKPLEPRELYLTADEWRDALAARASAQFSPFDAPEGHDAIDCGARPGRDFAPERNEPEVNVFQIAADHVQALRGAGKTVVVAGWSDGSCERLGHVLQEHGLR
ncbi:MAG TPA: transcription-repair coupling factor, partial [Methylocystis sp.]|nr:transcription-repair coupling factor [Methylocystis sp.]